MIEIMKFIGRIFLAALVMASVGAVVLALIPYISDISKVADSKEILTSGDMSGVLYELLRIVLRFILVAITTALILTIVFGSIELSAIMWRGKGFDARYLKRVQTVILRSKLEYETLFDLCEDAVMAQCINIKTDEHRGIIEAGTKSKLTGLREKITVAIRKDGTVLISSKTTTRFASFYDSTSWGRNVGNVRGLVEYIRQHADNYEIDFQDQETSKRAMGRARLLMLTAGMGSLSLLLVVVGMTVAAYIASGVLHTPQKTASPMSAPSDAQSRQDVVRESVKQLKQQASFPIQVDETALLTDASEGAGAIRYHITFSDREGNATTESIKDQTLSNACQSKEGKELLEYMNIEYDLTIQETGKKHQFTLTKEDCVRLESEVL